MAATPSFDTFQEWIPTLALLSVGSLYAAYYLKHVASKPIIACGNPKLQEFLHKHVPSIFQVYWPPFWCFQGHVHTILAVGFRIFISKTYRREVTETPDGGEICLDWMDADDTSTINKARRPTVVIMPGLTGSSKESYIMHYADDMHRLGFRSVVFNQRGYGGSKLRTPRGFCAGNTEDIHFVISHVKKLYPDAPVAVIGLSIGGIILLNYLAEYGDKAPIVGALPVSAAWDLMKSNRSLEENLNWLLFNSYLTNNLRNYLKSNAHMIKDKYDVEHILQSKTIYQFDDRVTAKMFGYRNADHYYSDASPYGKIDKIKIPTLCLNAADDPFAPLKNLQLDEMVSAALGKSPCYGEKMVAGLLASKNVHVQRDRIRQSIRRVDPDGVEARKRVALHRRQYSVPGPNSLWHIDGNHKLIRWRFVVHGGIDGYSRLPVFLRCSTNNRAETMFSAFKQGVLNYGLPWTVRSDNGGENTSVCAFMMAHPLRGPDRGHFITGRSVHNQRIERLWRDMFTVCSSVYYQLFNKMEDANILDITQEIDMAALHFVFTPIINDHLETFRQSYMHHKLRTANNKTPLQLWHSAINGGFPVDFVSQEEVQQYMPQEEVNAEAVVIPEGVELTDDQLLALNDNFDVDVEHLQAEEDQISYFQAAKEFIYNLINH